ncbi:hypothetical protein FSHL1_000310 [Fusarium sambucinum]
MQEPDINTVGARFPCLEWLVLAEAKDNDIASTILDPNGEGILFTEDFVKAFKVFLLCLRKLLRNLPRLKRLAVASDDDNNGDIDALEHPSKCTVATIPLRTVEEHRPGLYVGIFPEQAAQVTPDEQVINHWSSIPVFFRTARCPGEQILQQIRGLNANKYCLDTNVVAEAEAFDSMYPVPGRNG